MRLVQVSVQLPEPTPQVAGCVPQPQKDSSVVTVFGCSAGAQHCASTEWWHLHFPPQTGGADREKGGTSPKYIAQKYFIIQAEASTVPRSTCHICQGIPRNQQGPHRVICPGHAADGARAGRRTKNLSLCFLQCFSASPGESLALLLCTRGKMPRPWAASALMPQCGSMGSRWVTGYHHGFSAWTDTKHQIRHWRKQSWLFTRWGSPLGAGRPTSLGASKLEPKLMQISAKRPRPEPRTSSAPCGAAAQCLTLVQNSPLSSGAPCCSSPAQNVAPLLAPHSTASLQNVKCRFPECQKGNLNVKTFVIA